MTLLPWNHSKPLLWDLTGSDSLAQGYVNMSANHPRKVACEAGNRTLSHYQDLIL